MLVVEAVVEAVLVVSAVTGVLPAVKAVLPAVHQASAGKARKNQRRLS